MSFKVVSNSAMKAAEARCDKESLSYSQMMYNAGSACAAEILPRLGGKSAAILCGSGNNGGDGFVIAKKIIEAGADCTVIMLGGEPKTDCAREHFNRFGGRILRFDSAPEEALEALKGAYAAVDCIFGTGFHGALSEQAAALIAAAGKCPLRVAVDVPSGVNSDTGEFDTRCFKPNVTLVLAAMKQGLLVPEANDLLGEIKLVDIGIDERFYEGDFAAEITDERARHPFPPRKRNSHKGTFGTLLVTAGSLRYSGAAALCVKAALRTGVGLCALATVKTAVTMLAPVINESTYLPLYETEDGFIDARSTSLIEPMLNKATAAVVGCGMGNSENTRIITEFLIKNADCPLIIDADGINSIAGNIDILKERTAATIVTPHPLEFSRLTGKSIAEIQRARLDSAKEFAAKTGCVTVLKGANTVIAAPDGTAYVNVVGNTGLSKGGSGDTLAGIIGAMAAQGIAPLTAAVSGVYCHALASDILLGRLPEQSMLASDVISALPEVFRSEYY